MTGSILQKIQSAGPAPLSIAFDGRSPMLLDHRGHVLKVTSGHVDIFAVGDAGGARHHLLRVEKDEIILFPSAEFIEKSVVHFVKLPDSGEN